MTSTQYQQRRKELARREYNKLTAQRDFINSYGTFDDWFTFYFLTQSLYQDMVINELGAETDYQDQSESAPVDTSSDNNSSDDSSSSYDDSSSSDSGSDFGSSD